MNVVIREMHIEDYDELIALWERAGLSFKPRGRDCRQHIQRELEGGHDMFLIAAVDGKIAGSVLGTHDGRKGWINRVAVDPVFRNAGIARMMVREVEQRLERFGIEIVACLIENGNSVSKEVFTHLGYIPHEDITYFTKRNTAET